MLQHLRFYESNKSSENAEDWNFFKTIKTLDEVKSLGKNSLE